MSPEKIARINELARLSRTRELSEAERLERADLRAEYLEEFRRNFTAQLDATVVIRPDGTREKLKRNPGNDQTGRR